MTTSYGASVETESGGTASDPELNTPLFIELMENLDLGVSSEAAEPGSVHSIDLRDPNVVVVKRASTTRAHPLDITEPVDYQRLAERAEALAPILTDYTDRSADKDRPDYHNLSRVWDLLFVLALGLMAVPLVMLAAIALKIEDRSAPVFYRQFRTGHLGRRFRIVKMRSMVPNADELKAELAEKNLRDGPDFKAVDDPRITRVGRFLRRTSIDELPQLWNVLTGEMTLVGPRPTSLNIDAYTSWQLERFDVKPGLTGLWQATARDSESWEDRLALDITYVRRACPSLDVWIVAKTIQVVLRGTGST